MDTFASTKDQRTAVWAMAWAEFSLFTIATLLALADCVKARKDPKPQQPAYPAGGWRPPGVAFCMWCCWGVHMAAWLVVEHGSALAGAPAACVCSRAGGGLALGRALPGLAHTHPAGLITCLPGSFPSPPCILRSQARTWPRAATPPAPRLPSTTPLPAPRLPRVTPRRPLRRTRPRAPCLRPRWRRRSGQGGSGFAVA